MQWLVILFIIEPANVLLVKHAKPLTEIVPHMENIEPNGANMQRTQTQFGTWLSSAFRIVGCDINICATLKVFHFGDSKSTEASIILQLFTSVTFYPETQPLPVDS